MKINTPTKFFAESPGDINYQIMKYRSTLMTRGDVVRKYAAYDSINESDWHIEEDVEKDSWVKFSFDGGFTYKLKFRYKNTLLMKFLRDSKPEIGNAFEMDFGMYSQLDYSSIRNGRISVYAANDEGYLTTIPSFRYRFNDNTQILSVVVLMRVPEDTVKTVIMVELDGHSAMAMAVPTPVFSSFVGFASSSYSEELGWYSVLNSDGSELTVASNFDNVSKLYLKVKSADENVSGNCVVRFQCGSDEPFTRTIHATGNSTWVQIPIDSALNGTLKLSRVVTDSADTLKDGNTAIDLIITNIRIESFS